MPPSFEINAILRGVQLTIVGANRALQNPALFKSSHYHQAGIAVFAGLVIHLIISIPVLAIKLVLRLVSLIVDLDDATWDDKVVESLDFMSKHVLQIPFFLMTIFSHTTPTLDNLFMESLRWVDSSYAAKHSMDDPSTLRPMYSDPLEDYSIRQPRQRQARQGLKEMFHGTIRRNSRRIAISLGVYFASMLPLVGRLVLPAASFWTFQTEVGVGPAAAIFGSGLLIPRRYLIMFLQSYYSSRSLMRELLEPYFRRVHFTPQQKWHWFHDRQGVLFGFAFGFYLMLRMPIVGVFMYGIAEASTAYLVTKITDPPPPPGTLLAAGFPESQVQWKNKHEFLSLDWDKLDVQNVEAVKERMQERVQKLVDEPPRFT